MNPTAPNRSVWTATLGAALAAAVILVLFVLPAEYGVDPTGFGAAAGLTGLAEAPPRALAAEDDPLYTDKRVFTLEPYETLEYKYHLHEGGGLVFVWDAGGALVYDFHSEPEGAEEGVAESFDAGTSMRAGGTYIAPFDGEHGWYWENRNPEPVTVRLVATGFFDEAAVYRGDRKTELTIGGGE